MRCPLCSNSYTYTKRRLIGLRVLCTTYFRVIHLPNYFLIGAFYLISSIHMQGNILSKKEQIKSNCLLQVKLSLKGKWLSN
jgi:hypothetical protein